MGNKLKALFELDGSLLSFLKKIGWVFLINLLFLATAFPVVTIGPATAGMYAVYRKLIEEREFAFFGDYFRTFGKKFGKAAGLGMLALLVCAVLLIDVWYVFTAMHGASGVVMKIGVVLLCIAACAYINALFPFLAWREQPVRELLTGAALTLARHPLLALESVLFSLIIFGGSGAIIYFGWYGGLFILFPFLSFGLHGFMQSYLFKAMEQEPAGDDETEEM